MPPLITKSSIMAGDRNASCDCQDGRINHLGTVPSVLELKWLKSVGMELFEW